MVQFKKVWVIRNIEDYNVAIKTLKEWDYTAQMTDDHYLWKAETEEIARQRKQVEVAKAELGL